MYLLTSGNGNPWISVRSEKEVRGSRASGSKVIVAHVLGGHAGIMYSVQTILYINGMLMPKLSNTEGGVELTSASITETIVYNGQFRIIR